MTLTSGKGVLPRGWLPLPNQMNDPKDPNECTSYVNLSPHVSGMTTSPSTHCDGGSGVVFGKSLGRGGSRC